MCDTPKDPTKAEIDATLREMKRVTHDDPLPGMSSVRVQMKGRGLRKPTDTIKGLLPVSISTTKRLYPHQKAVLNMLGIDKDSDDKSVFDNMREKLIADGCVFVGMNRMRSSVEGNDIISLTVHGLPTGAAKHLRDALDESHQINDRSALTDEEKEYLKGDPLGYQEHIEMLRAALPVGAVELTPGVFYVPLEWSEQEAHDRLAALPTDRDDDDEELVDIGNGKKMARKDLRKIIHGLGSVSPGGTTPGMTFSPSPLTQAQGRMKRVDDMSDDDLVKELTPAPEPKTEAFFSCPTEQELDAMDYPMPGHRWVNAQYDIAALVLKSTTRCLWVAVEMMSSHYEVNVMSREQFRSFLTHGGAQDDWKTRRPKYKAPQCLEDTLRYTLTRTDVPDTDEMLGDLIAQNVPYIEHTPV